MSILMKIYIICLFSLMVIVWIFIIAILSGCASKPIKIEYNCPTLSLPADPEIYTKKITDKSNPNEVMKAWVATAAGLRSWNLIVRKQNQRGFGSHLAD